MTMLACGTALILMPQIHAAVLAANLLHAAAIARHSPRGAEDLPVVAPPAWMAPMSVALGGCLILGACGMAALGRPEQPARRCCGDGDGADV